MCNLRGICLPKSAPNQLGKSRAAGQKAYFWEPGQTIYIAFMGGTTEQHSIVKKYAMEWTHYANLDFQFVSHTGFSHIRISFDELDGAWSYIGTACLSIAQHQPTMNLGWIDQGVVLHEFGHAIGLIHEHQNPINGIEWDFAAIKADLSGPPNYWSDEDIFNNIINQYSPNLIEGTDLDVLSIMMYAFPARWTKNGFSVVPNQILSEKDKEFIRFIYPEKELIEPTEPNEENDNASELDAMQIRKEIFVKMFPTYRHIKTMRESSVVHMAQSLGLQASIKDREIDTVRKIFEVLYPLMDTKHIQ